MCIRDRGLFAYLVGGAGGADSAFGGGKALMAGQEGKALGVFAQQHSAQVAMAQAHGALIGDGTGDAERLQALADGGGGFGGGLAARCV